MKRLLAIAVFGVVFGLVAGRADAATIKVCAGGTCGFTNTQLQAAIDSAAFGDTILLQQNITYVGTFLLRQKTCAANNATCYITIKTGVDATGNLLSASLFPAVNMRTGPTYGSVLAKLQTGTNNQPALRTVEVDETGSGCASAPCKGNWWTIQNLEVIPNTFAGGELIRLGSNNDYSKGTVAASPAPTTTVFTLSSVTGLNTSDAIFCASASGAEEQRTVSAISSFQVTVSVAFSFIPGDKCRWGNVQDTRAEIPSHFIVDRVYLHGDPVIGQKRGIAVHANDFTMKDSYCADIKNTGQDGQCVYINNSEGPYVFTNNYLEADGENFLSGGDTPRIHQTVAVSASPTPTTTVFTVASVTDLQVGQGMSCLVSGGTITNVSTVTGISGNQITVSPALTAVPDVPGACNWGVVPAGLTFTKNYLTKQLAWRNPIVSTPTGVGVSCATTGGALAAGTPYFYRVVARLAVSQGNIARSTASTEVSDAVASGTTGSCTITWTAVPTATTYYIYGRSAGGENHRFSVTAPTVTFTDTGAAGTTETVPTSTGTKWIVKNVFELKNANGATVQGNVFERAWQAGQSGYCVLFTVANTSDGNTSTIVKDVLFRDNIIRSCAGLHQITGHDASTNTQTSQRGQNIQLLNNLAYDIGSAWGASTSTISIASPGNSSTAPREGPKDVVIDHYTVLASGADGLVYFNLGANSTVYTVENMTLRNSIFRRGGFGIRYTKSPGGTQIEGATSWTMGVSGTSVYTKNVNVAGNCTNYPDTANNFCPTEAAFTTEFVDYVGGNYALKTTSPYHNAATDSTDIGAIIPTITAFTTIATSGDNSGGAPANPPVITTSTLPDIPIGVSYSRTLTATGGTTPYTWARIGGALPTGLSLSSAGVISGLPTVAETAVFTVQVTDAASATDTRALDLTVNELPSLPSSGNRVLVFGWNEAKLMRRPNCLTDVDLVKDQARVGDLCVDLTANQLYVVTSTSPALVVTSLSGTSTGGGAGGGGGGTVGAPAAQTVTLYAGAALTASNVPGGGTEFGSALYHVTADVENSNQIAVDTHIVGACSTSPAAVLRVDYWDGAAWQPSGASVACNTGYHEGTFSTLAVAARTQSRMFRAYWSDGDGVADPSTTAVKLRFRTSTSPSAPASQTVTLYAGASLAQSNVPAGGDEFGTSRYRTTIDTENSTQISADTNMVAACSVTPTALLRIDYWDGAAWQPSGATVSCAVGYNEGSVLTLAVPARAQNTRFRAYWSDGDGAADPSTSTIKIRFQTTGGTGAPAVQMATLYAGATLAQTNVAVGGIEFGTVGGVPLYEATVNVENSTQIAVDANIVAACSTSPAAVLRVDYWDGAAWQPSGGSVACTAGYNEGTFATLAVGARTQAARFRAYWSTGDSVADPSVTTVKVRFR
jgi:hypothetical protein